MKISDEELRKLAELSALTMSDSELAERRSDLEQILEFVGELSKVDVDEVRPTFSAVNLDTVWRDDEVVDYGVSAESLLALRPDNIDNMTKVPKVL